MITTASGVGLSISNIGTWKLVTPTHTFTLRNVLHVPRPSQHLLSIYQLCKDNQCRFICDDISFWVQDKITGKILLKGLCRAGHYLIPFNPLSSQKLSPASSLLHSCYHVKPVSKSLWHKRLGHQSNAITSATQHHSKTHATTYICLTICIPCLEGKFTKIPIFFYPSNKSVHPLEVIHSDVWGHALVLSFEGYRYYVSFVDECTRYTWVFLMNNK